MSAENQRSNGDLNCVFKHLFLGQKVQTDQLSSWFMSSLPVEMALCSTCWITAFGREWAASFPSSHLDVIVCVCVQFVLMGFLKERRGNSDF